MASLSKSRVALVQMQSSENKQDNLEKSLKLIREASDRSAEIVCFPEFQMAFSPSCQSLEELSGIAESLSGPFVTALSDAARSHGIRIVSTLYEKSKTKKVYDTAIVLDRSGKIVSAYRKLHLYDALGFKESTKLIAGGKISKPVRTRPWNIGLLICYDIRFPELSRMLAIDGANVLIAPSAWVKGDMKEEHWQIMVKARAIENGAYIIAPAQVGNIYCGKSLAVDPFGVVLVEMGQKEGLDVVELDLARVKQVRTSLPLLKNRRSDIYKL